MGNLKRSVALLSILLILGAAAGCGRDAEFSGSEISPPGFVSERDASPYPSEAPRTADEIFADASPVNFRQDSPFDHGRIKQELLDLAGMSAGVYDSMKREYGFYFPTDREREELLDIIAGEGHIVLSEGFNMRNADLLKDAYNRIQPGQQSEFCVYYIDPIGQISRASFLHKDGVVYYTCPYIEFDTEGGPSYQDTDMVRALDVLTLTEKGYLIYGANGAGFAGFGGGYRAEPLPDEHRELEKKYLAPLEGYHGHNVLVENWDQDNMTQIINFNDVFDVLYAYDTGESPRDVFKTSYSGEDYQRMAAPSEDFERVITKYFPVTAEELHSIAVYDEAKDIYAWAFVKGGGYSPDFEVVDYRYNPDGSLTITFDALDLRHGDDRNATNTLTVMPRGDGGFHYISNVIERNPEKEPWIPAYYPVIRKRS